MFKHVYRMFLFWVIAFFVQEGFAYSGPVYGSSVNESNVEKHIRELGGSGSGAVYGAYDIGIYYESKGADFEALSRLYFRQAYEGILAMLPDKILIGSDDLVGDKVLIAEMYRKGQFVKRDHSEALAWYFFAHLGAEKFDDSLELNFYGAVDYVKSRVLALSTKERDAINLRVQQLVKKYTKEPKGSGTGFFVSSEGYLVTAYHVVEGAVRIVIEDPAINVRCLASVVAFNKDRDYAILKVVDSQSAYRLLFQPVETNNPEFVSIGQEVTSLGYPNIDIQGRALKFTRGDISSNSGLMDDPSCWQLSVPLQPGNSGGPIFDQYGNAIGVVLGSLSLKAIKVTGAVPQNVNYALKINYLFGDFDKFKIPYNSSFPKRSVNDETAKKRNQAAVKLILIY